MEPERGPSFFKLVAEYWGTYGGKAELFRSPYLYFAILLVPATYGIWSKHGWWSDVLSIIPGLMGISLAAFTLFLSAGSEKFREIIAGEDEAEASSDITQPSPFRKTASVFLHFLVVQIVAIILAFIAKSSYSLPAFSWFEKFNEEISLAFWCVCFFIFTYSLLAALAASFAIFEVVNWFDDYVTQEKKNTKDQVSR